MDLSQIHKFADPVIGVFRGINVALIDSWWLTIGMGILLCFFGIKIFSASVFWFAALLGGFIGYGIGSSLFGFAGGVVCAAVLGIICGCLLRTVVRIGFFLVGLLTGGLIGTGILGNSLWVIPLIVVSGIFSIVFYRYFIMLATAMWGAILLTGSLLGVIPISLAPYPYAVMTIKAAICIGGLAYQGGFGRESEGEED